MKRAILPFGSVIAVLILSVITSCSDSSGKQRNKTAANTLSTNATVSQDTTVYKSENLVLHRISQHVYQHISFLNTHDFGRVPCNGMVVVNDGKAIIFDTPADNKSSDELINYVTQGLSSQIIAIIPTHFHDDCVGGIAAFARHHIPCYASDKTIEILKKHGNQYAASMKGFTDRLSLHLGNDSVLAIYPGEGHTRDNIVGYFPDDSILFGGCLVKESGASKGYLGDANVPAWPVTVARVKQEFPDAKMVIPGHGQPGGTKLLDYTIELFSK